MKSIHSPKVRNYLEKKSKLYGEKAGYILLRWQSSWLISWLSKVPPDFGPIELANDSTDHGLIIVYFCYIEIYKWISLKETPTVLNRKN